MEDIIFKKFLKCSLICVLFLLIDIVATAFCLFLFPLLSYIDIFYLTEEIIVNGIIASICIYSFLRGVVSKLVYKGNVLPTATYFALYFVVTLLALGTKLFEFNDNFILVRWAGVITPSIINLIASLLTQITLNIVKKHRKQSQQ